MYTQYLGPGKVQPGETRALLVWTLAGGPEFITVGATGMTPGNQVTYSA